MKSLFIALVKFYQRYISILFPACCRYYPSCSEYSLWQFRYNNFFKALAATILRILRCNPLFNGGIDYPVIKIDLRPNSLILRRNLKIKFWFVPCKNEKFYVIKSLKKEK